LDLLKDTVPHCVFKADDCQATNGKFLYQPFETSDGNEIRLQLHPILTKGDKRADLVTPSNMSLIATAYYKYLSRSSLPFAYSLNFIPVTGKWTIRIQKRG
jgi:hypothetical protein